MPMPPMPTRDAFDRNLRAALGIGHRGANRFGQRVLIGHAALAQPADVRQAVRQIADLVAFQRADDAARAGTARVQADRELGSSMPSIPPP